MAERTLNQVELGVSRSICSLDLLEGFTSVPSTRRRICGDDNAIGIAGDISVKGPKFERP